ncbi:Uncharacterised protein [Mycolicibacterium phlei]|uniref:Uncharacterized protein n=1 Tax=Mycolicibacterium phlei DSM 43239 = CCUG 21000 TaxID=1226750 RepID=A0A5N5V399_MYCPH|nr:hypothetical protein [Mycolicibacterium phlei]VEG10762.1 Uncharacterised protein [Mycobacteroides chelonae]AMO62661.1 hypothetical protein MPHLCCUG_03868 [Mycolicibacterium phlei]KAB7756168.1 hypothetical protein MPHL21000_11735 [Mycolicibacterium phlei DSM 43239 = CCUG 21000]KXW61425.1 hypothetical protein MPHL43239_19425 [Mycolicibacterium phlei DSM 43239 = CCUG 21000]KXW65498.1 hypothetical protein MPHL43070_04785 [Mycolicibacterium phlei DSM 43070]
MSEPVLAPADPPTTEALATTGLLLIVTAVIAVALCLASWSVSDTLLAATSGIIAALSFAISMVLFVTQSRQD